MEEIKSLHSTSQVSMPAIQTTGSTPYSPSKHLMESSEQRSEITDTPSYFDNQDVDASSRHERFMSDANKSCYMVDQTRSSKDSSKVVGILPRLDNPTTTLACVGELSNPISYSTSMTGQNFSSQQSLSGGFVFGLPTSGLNSFKFTPPNSVQYSVPFSVVTTNTAKQTFQHSENTTSSLSVQSLSKTYIPTSLHESTPLHMVDGASHLFPTFSSINLPVTTDVVGSSPMTSTSQKVSSKFGNISLAYSSNFTPGSTNSGSVHASETAYQFSYAKPLMPLAFQPTSASSFLSQCGYTFSSASESGKSPLPSLSSTSSTQMNLPASIKKIQTLLPVSQVTSTSKSESVFHGLSKPEISEDLKRETSSTKHDECCSPHFEPLITLPLVDDIRSGEEDEKVVFSHRAKLYRFDNNQWKERGVGDLKILKHKITGKVRLLMRRDQTLKICCNHYITGSMSLTQMKGPTQLAWYTSCDFSDGVSKPEKFTVKFKHLDTGENFKQIFEGCVFDLSDFTVKKQLTSEPIVLDKPVLSFSELAASQSNAGPFLMQPNHESLLPYSSTESGEAIISVKSIEKINDYEAEDDLQFKALVTLPEVEVKTGEELEKALFTHRAKLFRFDETVKQWKERGIGEIKLLMNTSTNKTRIVMRRDQILKICCNHFITADMKLLPFQEKSWIWHTPSDFADEIPKPEKFVVRFKSAEMAQKFKRTFEDCVSKISTTSITEEFQKQDTNKISIKENLSVTGDSWLCNICSNCNPGSVSLCLSCQACKPESKQKLMSKTSSQSSSASDTKLSATFKPDANSWECEVCLIRNKRDDPQCVACGSPKSAKDNAGDSINDVSTAVEIGSIEEIKAAIPVLKPDKAQDLVKPSMDSDIPVVNSAGGGIKIPLLQANPLTASGHLTSLGSTTPSVETDEPSCMPSGGIKIPQLQIDPLASSGLESKPLCLGTSEGVLYENKGMKYSIQSQDQNINQLDANESEDDHDDDVIFVCEEMPHPDLVKRAEELFLPRSFYLYEKKPACTGCRGCVDEEEVTHPSYDVRTITNQQSLPEPSAPTKASGTHDDSKASDTLTVFSSAGMLSFADLVYQDDSSLPKKASKFKFEGAGTQIFTSSTSKDDGENPEAEADIDFEPIVSLPETYNVKSWDEDAETLFCCRAKLYRFDESVKQWKERGVGDMKIVQHQQTMKVRLIMRRDQILKLCCNHYLTEGMKLERLQSDRSWMWFTPSDFSDDKPQPEKLAIKFKHDEEGVEFRKIFNECIDKQKLVSKMSSQNLSAADTKLSAAFKPDVNSWECEVCLIRNKRDDLKCVACGSPKSTKDNAGDSVKDVFTAVEGGSIEEIKDTIPVLKPDKAQDLVKSSMDSDIPVVDSAGGGIKIPLLQANLLTASGHLTSLGSTTPSVETDEPSHMPSGGIKIPQLQIGPLASSGLESKPLCLGTNEGVLYENKGRKYSNQSQDQNMNKLDANESEDDHDDDVIFVCEEMPHPDLVKRAEELFLPRSFYLYEKKPACTGCRGCVDEEEVTHPSYDVRTITNQQSLPEPSAPTKASGIHDDSKASDTLTVFSSAGMLSFADLVYQDDSSLPKKASKFKFEGAGTQIFTSSTSKDDGENPEAEADIDFEPIVSLPETYNIKSWDEDAETLFCCRAKLYRFDESVKQWKERGIGDMKIVQHQQTMKVRLIMRRDQILKLCCNHYLTEGMKLERLQSDRSWMWFTPSDFSDDKPQPEKLAIKFKHDEEGVEFRKIFNECIDKQKLVSKMSSQNLSAADTKLSAAFKPDVNSWECEVCLIRNKRDDLKCVACGSPKSAKDNAGDSVKDVFTAVEGGSIEEIKDTIPVLKPDKAQDLVKSSMDSDIPVVDSAGGGIKIPLLQANPLTASGHLTSLGSTTPSVETDEPSRMPSGGIKIPQLQIISSTSSELTPSDEDCSIEISQDADCYTLNHGDSGTAPL